MRPRERLLRKRIPKEAIRDALEAWSDRLSLWEGGFTATVVAGLVVEYLPEIASFMSRAISSFVMSHAQRLGELGGLMVIVGVAGELWISFREYKIETDLRFENNALLAASSERIAQAEKATAEALESAAAANQRTEELRAQLADRHVSPLQMKILQRDLVALRGLMLPIYALREREPLQFGGEICLALASAGIRAELKPFTPPVGFGRGIALAYGDDAEETANTIERGFVAAALVGWPMDRAIKSTPGNADVLLQIT